MNWQQPDAYHLRSGCDLPQCRHGSRCGDSACNRYTVCRAWIRSRDGWLYSAFLLAPLSPLDMTRRTGLSTHLHTGDKTACFDAVKAHAQDHLETAA